MEEYFHRWVIVAFSNFPGVVWTEMGLQSENAVFKFPQGNVNGA